MIVILAMFVMGIGTLSGGAVYIWAMLYNASRDTQNQHWEKIATSAQKNVPVLHGLQDRHDREQPTELRPRPGTTESIYRRTIRPISATIQTDYLDNPGAVIVETDGIRMWYSVERQAAGEVADS